jgi:hypothetical protein
MSNTVLAPLTEEVTQLITVAKGAEALINGIAARQQAAIDKALENGATAAELAPLTELQTAVVNERTTLAAAVAANTTAEA